MLLVWMVMVMLASGDNEWYLPRLACAFLNSSGQNMLSMRVKHNFTNLIDFFAVRKMLKIYGCIDNDNSRNNVSETIFMFVSACSVTRLCMISVLTLNP